MLAIKGGSRGPWPPSLAECTKMRHFGTKIQKKFWGGDTAPSPRPLGEGASPNPTPLPPPFPNPGSALAAVV